MRKLLFFTILCLFQFSTLFAQQTYPGSALWELSNPTAGGTGFVASTTGQVNAADQQLTGMEINQYTGPEESQRLRIEGNEWPANSHLPLYFIGIPQLSHNFTISNDLSINVREKSSLLPGNGCFW